MESLQHLLSAGKSRDSFCWPCRKEASRFSAGLLLSVPSEHRISSFRRQFGSAPICSSKGQLSTDESQLCQVTAVPLDVRGGLPGPAQPCGKPTGVSSLFCCEIVLNQVLKG